MTGKLHNWRQPQSRRKTEGLTGGACEARTDQLAAVGQVGVALGAVEELKATKVLQKYASHSAAAPLTLASCRSRSHSHSRCHSLCVFGGFLCLARLGSGKSL